MYNKTYHSPARAAEHMHEPSRYLQHFSSSHDAARDGDPVALSHATPHLYSIHGPRSRAIACPNSAPFDPHATLSLPKVTCADLLSSRLPHMAHSVRLVLGVTSAPNKWGRKIRDGIRRTWWTYPSVNRSVVVCFVVGRKSVKQREQVKLYSEAARYGDIAILPHVRDGDGPFVTISKAHAWFRLASELLGLITTGDAEFSNSSRSVIGGYKATEAHPVRHIAKVDDDTFLNLPVLQRDLDSLHCRKHLYYGIFAFAGYNSVTYTKCGFDYGNKGGRYRRYGCAVAANGHGAAHPPFPWTSGALMLASTPLIVRIAAEPAIGDFVERSKLRHVQLGRVKSTDEDVAMGFYMSRFHLGGLANVTYVRINDQLTNLGCARNGGLYRRPNPRDVGKHFVKTAGGHAYVWSIVVDGMAPNVTRCIQWTGDGRL